MKTAKNILYKVAAQKGDGLMSGQTSWIVEAMEEYLNQYVKDCPECEGDMEPMSACCGASIDTDILICRDCKEHSELAVCETCNGLGKIIK